MRRTLILGLSLIAVAAGVHAQSAAKPRVEVTGGIAVPTDPRAFGDAFSLGFGGGLGVSLAGPRPVEFSANVDFTTFELDKGDYARVHALPDDATISGGERTTLYLSATIKWYPVRPSGLPLRLYLLGGGGFFRLSSDDVIINGVQSSRPTANAFAAHGGGGVDLAFGPFISVFVEALYVVGFTDTENTGFVPLRMGLAFDIVSDV